jgi:phosphonate transport system substrate-binding protein
MGILLLLCSLLAARSVIAEAPPIKLGIMPFNSTLALIRTHQSLTAHLEKSLGRKVQVLTSQDYFTHINQVMAGDFDLLITGPHFGAMAAEKAYLPLFRYSADLQPSFVVRKDSTIKEIADVRGKRLGMPHRLAVISSGGIKWLDERGLRLNRDYQSVEYPSHGASIAAVASGEVDMALSAATAWQQTQEGIRGKTQLLATDIRLPHVMTLAHRRLPKNEIARIRQALLSFGDTPAGQAFFRDTGYHGYREISAADLEQLRPFIELTVKMMRASP